MINSTGNIQEKLHTLEQNLKIACEQAGRSRSSVKLVIVTKTATLEQVKEVVRLGYNRLGENRVQHLKHVAEELEKFLNENPAPEMPEGIQWHMIGHLQRNKVKQVLKVTDIIHSVDTLRLAEEISGVSKKLEVRPRVLLQVNCSQEPQKYGVPVGAAMHLAEQITTMANLRLCGLMTMAPLSKDKAPVEESFSRARELFEEIRGQGLAGDDFRELSMGMSQDYPLAIKYGATILRIGSAIFA